MKFLAILALLIPALGFAKADTYKINEGESKLGWVGKKLTGQHNGYIKIKSGSLQVEKDAITGGEFQIDMTSLVDEDLTDPENNKKLVGHLKSEDFFSVEKNPVASFKITKVEKKDGKQMVTGDLTIKGITHSETFPVTTTMDAGKLTAEAKFELDRTKWDIKYRSARFVPNIGDKVIHDKFEVSVKLAAKK